MALSKLENFAQALKEYVSFKSNLCNRKFTTNLFCGIVVLTALSLVDDNFVHIYRDQRFLLISNVGFWLASALYAHSLVSMEYKLPVSPLADLVDT